MTPEKVRTYPNPAHNYDVLNFDARIVELKNKQVPSDALICVTEHAFVIAAPNPLLPNHVLVFPRKCIGQLSDNCTEAYVGVWSCVEQIGCALKKATSATGISILTNDIVDAKKPLQHTYINVIPRIENDLTYNDKLNDLSELNAVFPSASSDIEPDWQSIIKKASYIRSILGH